MTVLKLTLKTPRVFEPLLAPARYKGAWGGRGSGKSHFFAEYVLKRSLAAKIDVVCIREIQASLTQSVKKLLEEKISSLGLAAFFTIQDKKIISLHGGSIIFAGMQSHNAHSIKSLEGFDIAWVEEAQSLSQQSLDLLRPTIRKPGSELLFSWNPDRADDPIEQLLRVEPPASAIVVRANYQDNPWLPEVLFEEMRHDRDRNPDKYAHVWLGEYRRHSEARVFNNWRVEDFTRPEGVLYRFGADWGFARDPTVLVRCSVDDNRLYVDYEAYQVGCDIHRTPALFQTVPMAQSWPIIADSCRPELISYLKQHGFPKITYARKGAGSVQEGVTFLQSFELIVHPRCRHTIDELSRYCYKTDPASGEILPVLSDSNNHVIDALRYACEGLRRCQKKPPPSTIITTASYRRPLSGPLAWMGD